MIRKQPRDPWSQTRKELAPETTKELRPQIVYQEERRPKSLVTPVTFYAALGTSSTTVYTGKEDELFLIRHIAVENTTGGALDLTLSEATDDWITAQSVAANTTEEIAGIKGMLMEPGENLNGLGSASGLTVFGWGLRIEGSGEWVL